MACVGRVSSWRVVMPSSKGATVGCPLPPLPPPPYQASKKPPGSLLNWSLSLPLGLSLPLWTGRNAKESEHEGVVGAASAVSYRGAQSKMRMSMG